MGKEEDLCGVLLSFFLVGGAEPCFDPNVTNLESLSMAFRKPNGMRYTECISQFASGLGLTMGEPMDTSLRSLIRLQRIAEEADIAFGYGSRCGSNSLDIIGPAIAESAAKEFHDRLERIRAEIPQDIFSTS